MVLAAFGVMFLAGYGMYRVFYRYLRDPRNYWS